MNSHERLELSDQDRLAISDAAYRRPAERLPIFGWWLHSRRWWATVLPIVERIDAALEARDPVEASVWGDEDSQEVARAIVEAAREEVGWANDRFLPCDSAYVPFWSYADASDVECALQRVCERLGLEVGRQEMIELFTRYWIEQPPLEEFVAYLKMRRSG
jgi:hypothetical protein